MSMNIRNLIIPMIFILFLCIGVASASDMEDISNPNMVLTDENHLSDNSMENNLNYTQRIPINDNTEYFIFPNYNKTKININVNIDLNLF